MKIKSLTAIISIIMVVFGCQDTKVVEVDIPYSEYVVIYGELKPDNPFEGISITKTLPLNRIYNHEQSIIQNALAYLRINEVDIIPLRYYSDGKYKPYNSLYPFSGDKYEVFIDLNNKQFYCRTFIPYPPDIVDIDWEGNALLVKIRGKSNESYGATWAVINDFNLIIEEAEDMYSVVESKSNNDHITVRTKTIPDNILSDYPRENLSVIVYSFDSQFANYFNSKSLTSSIDNGLTQGGAPIYTNLIGKDVIGMITGSSFTVERLYNSNSNRGKQK